MNTLDRESAFKKWYDSTRSAQMSESSARQVFFSGAIITEKESARLQSLGSGNKNNG